MQNNQNDQPENDWMRYMKKGDFEKAWQFSDAYLASHAGSPHAHLPRHLQNIWDGSPLNGKRVLVRCYHGLGDTIQFIRYAPLLKKVAAEVIVWAQPQLLPLLQTAKGIDQLLPLHDNEPGVPYDVDIEIMELPHIFRTTVETILMRIPYLHVKRMPMSYSDAELSVGLVWKAGGWDDRRDIPFGALAPLFRAKGVRIYILQANAKSAGWQEGLGIYNGDHDLPDYARIIRGLDLLISVDSMPVHLAGALAVPTWNLLHADADWRWMTGRNDSPWYPTMTLFRQQQPGEWEPVILQVAKELEKITTQAHGNINAALHRFKRA